MSWSDGLTGTVLTIASTSDSPLRVQAGPGTGKSFALQHRVMRLLESGQDPTRILVVTFTRNAAAKLLQDLGGLASSDGRTVRVGTLHAFCYSLLRCEDTIRFTQRVPQPVVTFTTYGVLRYKGETMLDDLVNCGDFGGKRDCTKRIRAFEAAWARLQSETPGWPREETDESFETQLVGWLRFHQAMLIGEVVPIARRFLQDNPASPTRSVFDHVIVDEYQDLNKAEQELIDLLTGDGTLAVVGDADQSIFRFRHANPEGIEDFQRQHAQTHDETLIECRRCPTRVVTIANSVIRYNHPGSTTPRLQPKADNLPGKVSIVQWNGVSQEAQGIASFVDTLLASSGNYSKRDVMILSPRRLLGCILRDELKARGIAACSFYHEDALESAVAQHAFALLSLMANQDDSVALRWWVGEGSPTSRKGQYKRLRDYCETHDMALRLALEALDQGTLTLANVSKLVARYRELLREKAGMMELGFADVVDRLFPADQEDCHMLRDIALSVSDRVANVSALYERMRTSVTQPETPEEDDYVRIMSLHQSKGLTSKIVVVTDCIQGLIPFVDVGEDLGERALTLMEQRRLFYVAVTRCTDVLVLSSIVTMEKSLAHKMRFPFIHGSGPLCSTTASQFMRELGPTAPESQYGPKWQNGGYGL